MTKLTAPAGNGARYVDRLETKVREMERDKRSLRSNVARLEHVLTEERKRVAEPSREIQRQLKVAVEQRDLAEQRERAAASEATKWRKEAEQAKAVLRSLGHPSAAS